MSASMSPTIKTKPPPTPTSASPRMNGGHPPVGEGGVARRRSSSLAGRPDGPPPAKKVKVGARASIACEICRKRKVRCSADYPTCSFCSQRQLQCVYDGHPDTQGPRSAGPEDASPILLPNWAPELPSPDALKEAVKAFFERYAEEGVFAFFHRPTLTRGIDTETASTETLLCILAVAARFSPSLYALKGTATATSNFYAQQALTLIQRTPSEISLTRLHSYLLLGLHECTDNEMSKGWFHIGLAIRMAQLLRLGFLDEQELAKAELDKQEVRNWKGEPIVQATTPVVEQKPPLPTPPLQPPHASTSSSASIAPHASDQAVPPSAAATAQILELEIRRRTWWSCFLLERLFCDGRALPAVLRANDVTTRFPCPDSDFIVGRRGTAARFLGPAPPWGPLSNGGMIKGDSSKPRNATLDDIDEEDEQDLTPPASTEPSRLRYPSAYSGGPTSSTGEPDADLYGQMMRVADLWAQVRSYIANGGRNWDRRAPWIKGSTFWRLDRKLNAWDEGLPAHLQYSESTLTAHSMIGQGKLYGLMHLLYFTALLYLHRDYIPFIPPLDYDPAKGPVDGDPLWFPADMDQAPPPGERAGSTWWADSAATCFRAAHAITDLYISLKSRGSELTNPFAGFSVLTAGTMHIHLCYWPNSAPPDSDTSLGSEYLSSDTRILNDMRQYWPAAEQWCQALNTNYALNSLIHDRTSSDTQSISQPLHVVRQGVMTIIRMHDPDALISASSNTNGKDGSSPAAAAAATLIGAPPPAPTSRPTTADPSAGSSSHQRRTTAGSGAGEVSISELNELLRKKHDLFASLTPPPGAGAMDWQFGLSQPQQTVTTPQAATFGASGGAGFGQVLDPALRGGHRPPSASAFRMPEGNAPTPPSASAFGFTEFDSNHAVNGSSNGASDFQWNEIALPMMDWSGLSMMSWGLPATSTGSGANGTNFGGGFGAATGGGGLESWFNGNWP